MSQEPKPEEPEIPPDKPEIQPERKTPEIPPDKNVTEKESPVRSEASNVSTSP